MAKNLVIVESPAKAKTINKYLGRDYLVKSSYGHVRDLPTGGDETDPADRLKKANEARAKGVKVTAAQKAKKKQAALIRRMGVDPEHGWAATYEIVPGKEKVIKELQEAAEKADKVWLASDLDREGEAIAWHLKECIGGPESRFARVTFNEITKDAIQEAFEHPGQVNENRVQAQQARRFLDRVVGFQVSPLLWAKVARGLSAGRVQSVAVRLIVEREREIKAFKPDEFWELHADLEAKAPLRAQVMRRAGVKFEPKSKGEIDSALQALNGAAYRVANSERKPQRSFPSAPFITSTLQAAASIRLGFSVKKTMTMAQRLYEAGHITYMRTDSVNLSAQAVIAVRDLIGSRFGAAYLPEKPVFYKSKAGAQEAHEAIRPTDANLSSQQIEAESDALRLYDLIWRQFVACQMPPAEFDTTTVTISAADCELAARGRVLRFDGFFKVQPPAKSDDVVLPDLAVGDVLKLVKLDPTQHFTKPPARYSEASLVKEMEKRGIGRPSTYAAIISTVQDRGYARLDAKRFRAEKLGEIVTERLVAAFPDLLDFGFTAGMEEDLDEIAEAKAEYPRRLLQAVQGAPAGGREEPRRGAAGADADLLPRLPAPDGDQVRPHRRIPLLQRLRPAAQGALRQDPQPGARRRIRGGQAGRGDRRRGGAGQRRRGRPAAGAAPLPALRHGDGCLAARREAPPAHLRQQPELPRRLGRGGRVQDQGLRRPVDPLRQVRQADAAEDRTIRQVLRLHRLARLQQHAQAAAQRPGRAAQDPAGADARAEVQQGGRHLRPARRRQRPVPLGQDLPQGARDEEPHGRGSAAPPR